MSAEQPSSAGPTAGPSSDRPARSRPGPRLIAILVAISVVWLGGLGALGAVAGSAVAASGPDKPVRSYLQALVDGHASVALKLGGIRASGQPLLTDAAYRAAGDRVTGFSITSSQLSGDSAVVIASVAQAGTRYGVSFHLESARKVGPLTVAWRLQRQTLPSIRLAVAAPSAAKVRIDGVSVAVRKGAATLLALPGSHAVSLAGGSDYAGDQTTLATTLAAEPSTASLSSTLSQAGVAAVQKAVDGWIDGCAASGELQPAGCPFAASGEAGVSYTDGHWIVDAYPSVQTAAWSTQAGGWQVISVTQGAAEFHANATQGGLSGEASTDAIPFAAVGTVTGFGPAGATFVPSRGYAADGGGGGGLGA